LSHSVVLKWHKGFGKLEKQFGRWWAYQSAKNIQNWTEDPRSCNAGVCQLQQKQGSEVELATEFCLMAWTFLLLPSTSQRDNRLSSLGDLIDSAYKDGTFLN
jgi:hypothetical protein